MDFLVEPIKVPPETNIIFGMSHFIKTVEDLYEVMVNNVPNAKFGIAFNEASGPRLVRYDGNNQRLIDIAKENQKRIGAGHTFLIVLEDAFPINILPAVKRCVEVVNIFCATANPVKVVIAKEGDSIGVMGVMDGAYPKGIEFNSEIAQRKKLLRDFGYKR